MTAWRYAIVFAVTFVAGAVNSIAGGGSLLSFPTLVLVGVPPITANATNTVGLWPGSLAGVLGFRRDMEGTRRWLLLLIWPSIVGGAIGAVILLHTPPHVFSVIAPLLVLGATLILALQDPLSRALGRLGGDPDRRSVGWAVAAIAVQFVVAVYGGFFGAGIGILMLAALGLLGLSDIHQMNGVKNTLAICINGVAALYFAVSGAVRWPVAAVMAVAAVLGGFAGAGVAHRFGRAFVRRAVIAIGISASVALTVRLVA